jgi:hypothetical protein
MLYNIADLSDDQLQTIRNLEEATGKTILALRRMDVLPADLSDEDLDRIQHLEVDLGLSLVAVTP